MNGRKYLPELTLGSIFFLGLFAKIASNGSKYTNISYMGGLSYLLYIIGIGIIATPLYAAFVREFNDYKKVSTLLSCAAFVLSIIFTISGLSTLDAYAENLTSTIGLGGITLIISSLLLSAHHITKIQPKNLGLNISIAISGITALLSIFFTFAESDSYAYTIRQTSEYLFYFSAVLAFAYCTICFCKAFNIELKIPQHSTKIIYILFAIILTTAITKRANLIETEKQSIRNNYEEYTSYKLGVLTENLGRSLLGQQPIEAMSQSEYNKELENELNQVTTNFGTGFWLALLSVICAVIFDFSFNIRTKITEFIKSKKENNNIETTTASTTQAHSKKILTTKTISASITILIAMAFVIGHYHLPASDSAITDLINQAAGNPKAESAVKDFLEENPKPSKGDLEVIEKSVRRILFTSSMVDKLKERLVQDLGTKASTTDAKIPQAIDNASEANATEASANSESTN